MRRDRLCMTVILVAALACNGCSPKRTSQAGPSGALPEMSAAIGPIPGPSEQHAANERANPLENDPGALRDGRRLFVQFNCSGCHGGHAGGGMGPSLRDPVWIYGNSPAHIFSSIAEGRANGMPAWGTMLPEDQLWRLVAYVRSLGTSQEPDAPTPAPAAASPDAAQPTS